MKKMLPSQIIIKLFKTCGRENLKSNQRKQTHNVPRNIDKNDSRFPAGDNVNEKSLE